MNNIMNESIITLKEKTRDCFKCSADYRIEHGEDVSIAVACSTIRQACLPTGRLRVTNLLLETAS